MSAWQRAYDNAVTADVNIPTTTETVVLTISGVTVDGPGRRVALNGSCQVTVGTGTTALTPRWRRGTDATGALVGEADPVTVAAGNTVTVQYATGDPVPDSAPLTYVLTVQQTGATANGNCLQASGTATV